MKETWTVRKSLFQRIKVDKVILINAGSLVGTTAVTSGLGFIYWWLAARQNSAEAVGLASAEVAAMTLLGTFSILGLGTLLIGELPRQKGQEASLVSAALLVVGLVGAIVGIGYALIAPYLSHDFQSLNANAGDVILFALGVSLTAVTSVLDQAFIGLLRGEMQLWRNALFSVIKLAALLAADLWLSQVTGLTIYVTWIIGNVFSLVVFALFLAIKRIGTPRSYLPQWKLLRRFGSTALKHHALNLMLQAPALVLPVLVTIMLSATVNAWFYVAWNLGGIANAISASLASTLYAVSSAQPSVLANKLRLTVSLSFGACALVNLPLIVAPKLALGIFGHGYAEQAAFSLCILSLESFPFIIKNHYIALSRIRNQMMRTTLVTLGTGLLEMGGSVVGAHLGGLNGLSLGWFFAMCIEGLCMAPTVYLAARPAKAPLGALAETDALRSPVIWNMETMRLPVAAKPETFASQAAWLLETVALTAIRPGIVEADTLHLQRVETRSLKALRSPLVEERGDTPGHRKQRLKPTRLERISLCDPEHLAEESQEQNTLPFPLAPTE